jgi:hypothetical protein
MIYSANWITRCAQCGFLFSVAATSGAFTPQVVLASLASATFQINQASSNLEVTVQRGIISDMDSNPLAGSINATFDFGSVGSLPATAGFAITGAALQSIGEYNFALPRIFPAVRATGSGFVTDVNGTTILTKPAGPGTSYQYDASPFTFTMVDGVIIVTGLVNETVDLSEEEPPISGASPTGTIGSLGLTPAGTSGFYTRYNAALNLPIFIDQTVTFGEPPDEEEIDLTLDGTVNATASFWVALAGVPGDFTQDGRVDDADLAVWQTGFGKAAGATLAEGDANADGDVDGVDFLVWQTNYGTAPPPITAAAVPEPTTAALIACGFTALVVRRCAHSRVAM